MDLATIIGLALGLIGIFGGTIMEGGSPLALLNIPAIMIVMGGTIGTAFIAFPLSRVLGMPKVVLKTFFKPGIEEEQVVSLFVNMADKSRREGLLSLEEDAQTIPDAFMRKGMLLMIDGTDPELVREILEIDMEAQEKRHHANAGILESMGGFAPTMGIIGTVLGLINVLGNLESPGELGHAIAGAFIATFYGVFTANLFYLPLAGKLKANSASELHMRQVMLEGIQSIQAGDNPRIVKEKLEGFLAPNARGKERKTEATPERTEAAA